MHILLIHQAFAALDEAGGTRHYELASFLARHGHRVTIIASPISYLTGKARQARIPWREEQQPEPGVRIIRTHTYSAYHKSFFHRIIGFFSFMVSSFLVGLSIRQVDLVWGTSPPIFQGVTAWLLARLKGVPFLFEVRDLWPAFAIAVGVLKNPLLIRLSHWLERFLLHRADQVMVNSPGFIEHVTQRGAKRVELIPNGADPVMFDPADDGAAFRQEHGLEGKFIVLYAGAHGLSNDLGVVLQAAEMLRDHAQVIFVFVGDGKEKPALQAQAQSAGLGNVLFLPPVAKQSMNRMLAAADACIAILKPIALYKTTYPNKVFDYMAAGKPVLLAIDGVIRQVMEQAGAGIFCQPGEPSALARGVLAMESDRQQTCQMGAAGRLHVERFFSRQMLAEQFEQVLIRLRGQKRR